MLLENKVAIITGGGAGLGKQMVKQFLEEGAFVVTTDNRPERVDALKAEYAGNENLHVLLSDVTKKEDNEALLQYAKDVYGRIDVLVNNAGVADGMTPVGEVKDEVWEFTMNINLNGPFQLCRGAINIMLETETAGSIINIASAAGLGGGRGGAPYTVSKWGLIGLTKNIAYMYGPKGIRCNAICPGFVPTEIMHNKVEASPYGMERVGAGTKPIRPGMKEEIADLAVYLASSKSSLISGETILGDAGKGAY